MGDVFYDNVYVVHKNGVLLDTFFTPAELVNWLDNFLRHGNGNNNTSSFKDPDTGKLFPNILPPANIVTEEGGESRDKDKCMGYYVRFLYNEDHSPRTSCIHVQATSSTVSDAVAEEKNGGERGFLKRCCQAFSSIENLNKKLAKEMTGGN